MIHDLLWILLGGGILLIIVGLWFGIYYWLSPNVKAPHGKARITGPCGDTMEISLQFKNDRVLKTSYWTDGCLHSMNSVCVATDLAKGKTPDEITHIDANLIQESIGGLPRDQLHCAELAEQTLQAALHNYLVNLCGKTCCQECTRI